MRPHCDFRGSGHQPQRPLETDPKESKVTRAHFAILCLFLAFKPAASQAPNENCRYDACSLRLEGTHVVRGRNEKVGSVGSFAAVSLVPLVIASSDSSVAYARVFDRNYGRGAKAVTGGSILMGVGIGVSTIQTHRVGVVGPSLVAVGAVATLWGAPKLRRAREALSRALWWNNRGLAL